MHLTTCSFLAFSFLLFAVGPGASQTPKQETKPLVDLHGDPLPAGALARLGTTRFRHWNGLRGIWVSPDGKQVVSAGEPSPIRIWDSVTGIELRQIPIDSSIGVQAAFASSPNGALLAAATDKAVVLWDVSSGLIVHQLKSLRSRDLAFSPDSRTLAALSLEEGIIDLWDVTTGNLLARLSPIRLRDSSSTASVIFSPNGKLLASSHGRNGEILLWDVATQNEIRKMPAPEEGVNRLAFSPDSLAIAEAGPKGTICLLNVATGEEIRRFQGKPGVGPIAFSPDGAMLARGRRDPFGGKPTEGDSAVDLWDVATGKQVAPLGSHSSGAQSLAFSRDGSFLYTGEGGAIRKYDLTTHKEVGPSYGYAEAVSALAFSADGKSLVSGGTDRVVRFWDLTTKQEIRQLYGCNAPIKVLEFSRSGTCLAAACQHGLVTLWDLSKLEDSSFIDVNKGRDSGPGGIGIALAPDGTRLATISHDGPASIWEVATKKKLQEFGDGKRSTPNIAYSPDGVFVATGAWGAGGGKEVARLWNVVTGQSGPALTGQPTRAESVTFSPDSKLLAAVTLGKISIWQTATGKLHNSFKCPMSAKIVFSPDGRMIASAGSKVQLWEVLTGKERCQFAGQGKGIFCLAVRFDPLGRTVATCMNDSTVLLWDLSGGRGSLQTAKPTAKDLTRWWGELAGEDAAKSYQAELNLIHSRDQAVTLLRENVRPAAARPNRTPELLVQLDSDRFADREQAMNALQAMGDSAEPALRKALAAKPSPEMRNRINHLLSEIVPATVKDPAQIRALRSVEVLEHIGQPALTVLEELATGAPEDTLTMEAHKSIKRMNGKKVSH